jgi:hypothetical protein
MLQLQEMLEAPLRGPESAKWRALPRSAPEEYERWQDAQLFSSRAMQTTENFKNLLYPLNVTRRKDVLSNIWRQINSVSTFQA